MAGNNPQKELFNLIRNFATEKSQGEHRVSSLKKQIEKLRSELDLENIEHEEAKRIKEASEQELKGYEVELAVNEASVQALEARIALTNDAISAIGSDVETLKSEEGAKRDEFIRKMFELNAQIRKFQESITSGFNKHNDDGTILDSDPKDVDMEDSEISIKDLENELAYVMSQTNQLEQEYQTEEHVHKQAQMELNELERKATLMEAIVRESAELQELNNSALEESYSFLGDELQRRCLCPKCHKDNSEAMGGLLQASDGS